MGYSDSIARFVATRTAGRDAVARRALPVGFVRTRIDPTAALVVAACAAASVACAYYGLRANTWAVMTDELQVARLATSIAETLSPVPTIRGEYYGAHSQLYPLLLAPLYGVLGPPAAAAAAHVVNAVLLVSAAVPAFLLARSVAGSTAAGYVAAALTAITPWLVLSTTLLTENAAYPAFAWAVFLCHRTLARPSPAADAAALAGLVVAFAARTQLLVLALALPAAVALLLAVSLARREGTPGETLRRALVQHRVLAGAYAAGALVSVVLVVAGSIGGVVGNYTVPFESDLVPPGFVRAAAEHLVQVALGVGVIPVVLATAWVATAAIHPGPPEARAFAALFALLAPLLVLQVTSFDLRFTPGAFIQDRYLVYLVPLFAVGTAAWLSGTAAARTRLVTAAAAGAIVVALLRLAPTEDTVIFWAAPAAAFRPAIASAAAWLGVSDVTLVQIAAVALLSLILTAAWRAPRAALAGTAVVLTAFGAVQAGYVFDRFVEPSLVRVDDRPRDWIDRAVPGESSVALVPGGVRGPTAWWEAEFWNSSVDRELRVDDGGVHTPFPVLDVTLDVERAALAGPQPSEYVVVAEDEKRFGLVESAELAARPPLRLVRVPRPHRLAWATSGLTRDGWTRPRRPATVRLFGSMRAERRALSITLAASARSRRPVPFVLRAPDIEIRDVVGPGGARPPVDVLVCIPARGRVDVRVVSRAQVVLRDGRRVSLHVERIELSDPWPCAAS